MFKITIMAIALAIFSLGQAIAAPLLQDYDLAGGWTAGSGSFRLGGEFKTLRDFYAVGIRSLNQCNKVYVHYTDLDGTNGVTVINEVMYIPSLGTNDNSNFRKPVLIPKDKIVTASCYNPSGTFYHRVNPTFTLNDGNVIWTKTGNYATGDNHPNVSMHTTRFYGLQLYGYYADTEKAPAGQLAVTNGVMGSSSNYSGYNYSLGFSFKVTHDKPVKAKWFCTLAGNEVFFFVRNNPNNPSQNGTLLYQQSVYDPEPTAGINNCQPLGHEVYFQPGVEYTVAWYVPGTTWDESSSPGLTTYDQNYIQITATKRFYSGYIGSASESNMSDQHGTGWYFGNLILTPEVEDVEPDTWPSDYPGATSSHNGIYTFSIEMEFKTDRYITEICTLADANEYIIWDDSWTEVQRGEFLHGQPGRHRCQKLATPILMSANEAFHAGVYFNGKYWKKDNPTWSTNTSDYEVNCRARYIAGNAAPNPSAGGTSACSTRDYYTRVRSVPAIEVSTASNEKVYRMNNNLLYSFDYEANPGFNPDEFAIYRSIDTATYTLEGTIDGTSRSFLDNNVDIDASSSIEYIAVASGTYYQDSLTSSSSVGATYNETDFDSNVAISHADVFTCSLTNTSGDPITRAFEFTPNKDLIMTHVSVLYGDIVRVKEVTDDLNDTVSLLSEMDTHHSSVGTVGHYPLETSLLLKEGDLYIVEVVVSDGAAYCEANPSVTSTVQADLNIDVVLAQEDDDVGASGRADQTIHSFRNGGINFLYSLIPAPTSFSYDIEEESN